MDMNTDYKTEGYDALKLRGENLSKMPAPDPEDVVTSGSFKPTVGPKETSLAKSMGKHK